MHDLRINDAAIGETMATAVTTSENWDLLYARALLEPNRDRLPERITAAEHAINERVKELSDGDTTEKDALADALSALRVLQARQTRISPFG